MSRLTNKPYWRTSREERRNRLMLTFTALAIGIAVIFVWAVVHEIRHPGTFADAQANVKADRERKYPVGGLTAEQALQITEDCRDHPDALRCL